MSYTTLGEYDFHNTFSINVLSDHEENINTTIIHESIHLILTQTTIWGDFSYILKRISLLDESFSYLFHYFHKQSGKMHECVAVFFECIYIIKNSEDFNDFLLFKNNLRKTNKKYFNYLRPLLFIFNTLDPKNDSYTKLTPEQVINIVFTLATISLNSSSHEISIDILSSKKLLKKFTSDITNANNFLPNRIFKNHLLKAKELLSNNNVESANELLCNILSENDLYYFNDKSSFFEKLMSDNKKLFSNLCKKSKAYSEIMNFIDSIELKEINLEEIPRYALPNSFNMYTPEASNPHEILNLSCNDLGILFLLGDTSIDASIKPLNKIITESEIKHLKVLTESFSYMISYMNYREKKNYLTLCNKNFLSCILLNSKSPLVITYKLLDSYSKTISGMNDINIDNEIHFYCDRTYDNSIEIINSFANKDLKFSLIEYPNFYTLVIEINEKTYFFLPFLSISLNKVVTDIKNGYLNLDAKNEVNHESFINFSSENIIETYDLIINSLFSSNKN